MSEEIGFKELSALMVDRELLWAYATRALDPHRRDAVDALIRNDPYWAVEYEDLLTELEEMERLAETNSTSNQAAVVEAISRADGTRIVEIFSQDPNAYWPTWADNAAAFLTAPEYALICKQVIAHTDSTIRLKTDALVGLASQKLRTLVERARQLLPSNADNVANDAFNQSALVRSQYAEQWIERLQRSLAETLQLKPRRFANQTLGGVPEIDSSREEKYLMALKGVLERYDLSDQSVQELLLLSEESIRALGDLARLSQEIPLGSNATHSY